MSGIVALIHHVFIDSNDDIVVADTLAPYPDACTSTSESDSDSINGDFDVHNYKEWKGCYKLESERFCK